MQTERWEVGIPATIALHQVERFRVEGKAGRGCTVEGKPELNRIGSTENEVAVETYRNGKIMGKGTEYESAWHVWKTGKSHMASM